MSYSSSSAADRLATVREAIDKVLQAQAMGSTDRTLTLANLRDLRDLERELMEEVQQEQGGGSMVSLGAIVRPR